MSINTNQLPTSTINSLFYVADTKVNFTFHVVNTKVVNLDFIVVYIDF